MNTTDIICLGAVIALLVIIGGQFAAIAIHRMRLQKKTQAEFIELMKETAGKVANLISTRAQGFCSPIGPDGEADSHTAFCAKCAHEVEGEMQPLKFSPYHKCSRCGFSLADPNSLNGKLDDEIQNDTHNHSDARRQPLEARSRRF